MNDVNPKMDLSVCEEDDCDEMEECDQENGDAITGCAAVNRLITTLKYYTLLDIIRSKDNEDIFAAFMNEVYLRFLDDFVHFMSEHNNLEQITKALKEKKLFQECDVTKCHYSSRHHSVDINLSDEILTFYAQTMDSLHFYIFHLFECGLRTHKVNDIDIVDDNKDEENKKYLDRQFTRIQRIINERKHLRLTFNRFKNNNKFNIAIDNKASSSSTTFMDALFCRLLSNNIKETAIKTFTDFIGNNNFDSDSIKNDFKPESDGYIAANIEDKALIKTVRDFIESTAIQSSSFNIGLIFYYWSHYQDMDEFEQNTFQNNINDHGGYKISALFVRKKYLDIKEEMSNYDFLNIKQMEGLNIKVKQYMETKNVKQKRAKTEGALAFRFIELKYDFSHFDGLLYRHVLSLFLYTDFTDLSNDFSSTFRPKKQFESLESIKGRNAKYWWMAISLREIVEIFGDTTRGVLDFEKDKYVEKLLGPFYCGLNTVIVFPEFELRLCGPTSTTKQLEISTTFAGKYGIIVQLNNNIEEHQYLSGFNCAAFSHFAEEAEILFMGGHYRITIQSVRILNGKGGECQNFESFFCALAKFNRMFNGGSIHRRNITKDEKEIISNVFNLSLGMCDVKPVIDEYVIDTFMAFRLNKQHIVFNYSHLCNKRKQDTDLTDLIFYGMKFGAAFVPLKEEKTNICGKQLFVLFPNIKSIDIYTTVWHGDPKTQCALSFEALLSEIETETFQQITVKAVHDEWGKKYNKNESWISLLWSSASGDLKHKYQQKGYKILLHNTKNYRHKDEDCVVIKKL